MSDARSTYRYAALLLGVSVVVVGVLIVNGVSNASDLPVTSPSAVADAGQPNQTAFDKWADDSDEADGKGRLIGEFERNGKIVELRQVPEGGEPDPANAETPADDSAADRSQPPI